MMYIIHASVVEKPFDGQVFEVRTRENNIFGGKLNGSQYYIVPIIISSRLSFYLIG